ncbi:MAG TPA: histidine phosphatase family protein [Clostridia bacterium]|nr:histidine phosphatase family protein [Clostridia bacterium]
MQSNLIRIGLVRHFEVVRGMPAGWMTWDEMRQWRRDYEASEVIKRPFTDGGIVWSRCLSSDSPRALQTAEAIYRRTVQKVPQLREAEIGPFRTGSLRLPLAGWRWLIRIAWLASHSSQRAAKAQFLSNVSYITQEFLSAAREDTLVVSHAGIMMFLRKELLRLGYVGPNFTLADHGHLYVFERRMPPDLIDPHNRHSQSS